jgi:hypothetical protein
MARLGREHAADSWRRQWQFPPSHRERTPVEHRQALAALDGLDLPEKSVAVLAREIADSWGRNDE